MAVELPLYEQARSGILEMIQDRLSPGELLPTQQELAKKFGASLITIKRALSELARDEVVESIRGRGTIVKGGAVTEKREGVSSWTDSIAGLGERPQTGWSTITREVPENKIRYVLNLKARQQVVRLERLRLVSGEPICLMTNCLPAERVVGFENSGLAGESLYQSLRENYGIHLHRANETVCARQATSLEKKHLGKDANIVLEIERIAEDIDGIPLEWAQVVAHAGRYRYQMQLINS